MGAPAEPASPTTARGQYARTKAQGELLALTAVTRVHGEPLVVTNGQPRPIGEFIERLALAGGAGKPKLRIPVVPALVTGATVDALWGLTEHDDEPPLTRFLAE